jgi:amidase
VITDLGACALSRAIHARELSCHEVMLAYLQRIATLNPSCNAIVNLRPSAQLLQEAQALDEELARGLSRGFLHGQPQAIKDTGQAAGLPTSWGSPLRAHDVAEVDSIYVARMKTAGCVVIGKTNVPELALGSNTLNPVFGATPNAWDATVTAGGSSGGAAVALAQRLLPVADGSDFMGSLRNPAGWNHVFGMRPSQGLVPGWPKADQWLSQLSTDGPMGRSVRDLAALLRVQAGRDDRAPLSLTFDVRQLVPDEHASDVGLRGLRIAWLGDLGGHLAMDDGVLATCEAALARCTSAGAHVEGTALGFSADALWQAWLVWRAALVAPSVSALLQLPQAQAQAQTQTQTQAQTHQHIKAEALWEHQQAQGLGVTDLLQASAVRTDYYQHLLHLFERFDLLALPSAQTWPFSMQTLWPRHINGRAMDTYHRWMEVSLYATFAGLPAISVPAGFHANGRWPMGLQLIGRPQGDAALLRAAAAYEAASAPLLAQRPADAVGP